MESAGYCRKCLGRWFSVILKVSLPYDEESCQDRGNKNEYKMDTQHSWCTSRVTSSPRTAPSPCRFKQARCAAPRGKSRVVSILARSQRLCVEERIWIGSRLGGSSGQQTFFYLSRTSTQSYTNAQSVHGAGIERNEVRMLGQRSWGGAFGEDARELSFTVEVQSTNLLLVVAH